MVNSAYKKSTQCDIIAKCAMKFSSASFMHYIYKTYNALLCQCVFFNTKTQHKIMRVHHSIFHHEKHHDDKSKDIHALMHMYTIKTIQDNKALHTQHNVMPYCLVIVLFFAFWINGK